MTDEKLKRVKILNQRPTLSGDAVQQEYFVILSGQLHDYNFGMSIASVNNSLRVSMSIVCVCVCCSVCHSVCVVHVVAHRVWLHACVTVSV